MNSQEKNTEDLLRQYLNPEMIENAPEGFTSQVMKHISVDTVPLKSAGIFLNINLVPLISGGVILILIMVALLIPGGEADSFTITVAKLFKNIQISLPDIKLISLFRFNLPETLYYVLVGILSLTLFDRALSVLFHGRK